MWGELEKSIQLFKEIKAFVKDICSGAISNEKGQQYKYIIFNGIGGSFLGPLMMLIAKYGVDYNLDERLSFKMFFVNNTDPESFKQVMSKVNLAETIMVNISKSGGTAETAGNMDEFNNQVEKSYLEIGKHNIAVTTPGSKFDKYSKENKFLNTFYMNESTGGRTSVGSAVGMVPAAFANINFDEVLHGQSYLDELTRQDDPKQNPAMIYALIINDLFERVGPKNLVGLGYSDAMKEVVHYLQQLFMESLGKEYDREGIAAKTGLTIYGGVGTGEQHAFMQQIQKGLEDAFVMIMHFRKRSVDFQNAKAVSMGRQLQNFVLGTEAALRKNEKEYVDIMFEENDPFNMGMMVAFMERVVTILGAFWGINPYDQPGVQDGKLSSDEIADISKHVEKLVAELAGGTITASQIARLTPKTEFKVVEIDYILSDMEANYKIENAYPELYGRVTIAREWNGKEWEYTFMPKK
jgi:glucose-6-phosphate isomerase